MSSPNQRELPVQPRRCAPTRQPVQCSSAPLCCRSEHLAWCEAGGETLTWEMSPSHGNAGGTSSYQSPEREGVLH